VNALTREQRIYAAAGASILFVISLFFNWFGAGGFDVSGTDVVPSWWVLLIFSLGAAALLVAEVISFELPEAINPAAWAAYLTSVSFIVTLMIFLEGGGGAGRKFGLFLALLFSLVAMILSVMHWREEAK
jgi:hypothetical protein